MQNTRTREVVSVGGIVNADTLGVTLMHEHIATRSPGVAENWPETHPRAEIADRCVGALEQVRRHGVACIVDHTTFDLGRDPALLREVSTRCNVTIVSTTGTWVDPPRFFDTLSASAMAELFVDDITVGMAGTDARAGLTKVALETTSPSERDRKAIEAAAITHLETGVSVTTHTSCTSRSAETLVRLLAQEGVHPDRILVGHAGDTNDVGYLCELLDQGCYVGLDRFGAEWILPDEVRTEVLMQLVEKGYASQLTVSHDASCVSGWRSDADTQRTPSWRMGHLFEAILPRARRAGLDEVTMGQILVQNPADFLTGHKLSGHPAHRQANGNGSGEATA